MSVIERVKQKTITGIVPVPCEVFDCSVLYNRGTLLQVNFND